MQLALIEPTGRDAVALAGQHLRRAETQQRTATIWAARGAVTLANIAKREAANELRHVDALCDLAQLEELAGLL